MIVLSGTFKGRKLKSPKGDKTRPTTSLVRKAVFDSMQDRIDNARFLDLFAGTGAMGFEALSRGAEHVTFIEQDLEALRCLKENTLLLQCDKNVHILRGNALLLLKKFKNTFDIIYIDPPYHTLSLEQILRIIDEKQLLSNEGHLFVETLFPSQEDLEKMEFQTMQFCKLRRFGNTLLYRFDHIN
jgi:16S rRNA (guanine966-N2)-methyltransferase